MFAAQGLLAALYERDALGSGRGQVVDVSLVESCFALLESVIPEYDLLGEVREPSGSRLEGLAPSNVFESADGARIVIAANQDSVFQRLCVAMGQPDLAGDARFATHVARGEHQEEIEAIVAEWARARPAREIDTLLNEAGVVCSPIYSSEDIFRDPHFRVREMLVAHDDPELGTFIGPGVIPKFSRTPGGVRWTGRARSGSDNDEVFGTLLGRSRDELEHLHASGVI
jgi:formyl-CoA transferase